ncbi:hypothetical protein IFO69_19005 [Echinicola sp. CAU 1574]|uniref:ABC-2 family transporter protein n=1 Tax=Echinicola arenosa TaxID=2774144 RepID=A0ABR9ATA5_9BACT|nr:hypothetical protein [Echinicola arenosa]MBD8490849.1 hypothetical protein [Echinicola arenosa]
MTTQNEFFSLSRFWNLLKYDFNSNKLHYIATLPVAMLGIATVLWIAFPGEIKMGHGYSVTSVPFKSNSYNIFLFLGAVIYGIAIVGNSFPGLKNEKKTLIHLLLPSSNLEKFLLQWGVRVFLFLVLYPILFKFTADITSEIYLAIHKYYLSSNNLKPSLFPQIEKFSFKQFIGNNPKTFTLNSSFVVAMYTLTVSIVFFGGTIFKRWNILLGPLSIMGLILIVFIYLVILSNILNPTQRGFWDINLNINAPKLFNDLIPLTMFTTLIFGILFSVVLWVATYFRFKEKEV